MTNKYTKQNIDIDKAIEFYKSGMTQVEVAKAIGTSQKVIFNRFSERGFKCRKAKKRNQFGVNNAYWKGGKVKSLGYILVKCSNHPRAKKCGDYVFEHILVVEKHLGRFLSVEEEIHHINGKKDDNQIENLMVMGRLNHMKIHRNHKGQIKPLMEVKKRCQNKSTI